MDVLLRKVRPCHATLRSIVKISRRLASASPETNNIKEQNVDSEDRHTHFGFKTVKESEKEGKVHEVFHNVASKYDLMNDVMSGGIHRVWKDMFIDRMAPVQGTKLIDVAGGTGDIAFRFLNYVKNDTEGDSLEFEIPRNIQAHVYTDPPPSDDQDTHSTTKSPPSTHVTVCDINQAMLDVGKKRAEKLGLVAGTSWVCGNAEKLPMADNSFDAYTIAFGIRNTTHVDRVLSEAYRVLRPGGRFMCLEFSAVKNPLLRKVYDEYSFQVIPVLGHVVAGDWHSYQYLVESIRQFPSQEDFAEMIREAGFKFVTFENLTFGVAAMHFGIKL